MSQQLNFVSEVVGEDQTYVAKANAGTGGVGYEKMIVTASLLSKIDNNKIIPIVRQASGVLLPTFLQSKVYINFSSDSEVEYSLDELLRTLLKAPLFEKPEIGSNPFAALQGARPDRTADGIKVAMTATANAFERNPNDQLSIGQIMNFTDVHRLKIERYLNEAEAAGLVTCDILGRYSVTNDGYDYLVNHGIVQA